MCLFGIERGKVVEEDLVLGELGVFEVYRFHLDQGEVLLSFLGRPHLSRDGIAGSKIELSDLRW